MKKLFVFLVLLSGIIKFSCTNPNSGETSIQSADTSLTGKLIIFHAGSMTIPLKKISEAFKNENPGVEIFLEGAGSRDCARKISDLNKECDIMVSADYDVIEELLIPNFSSWYIKFATNEMVIAFTDRSRYGKEINSNNWHEILLKKDVAFGRSDPNSDPCGYRSVLVIKLAEKQLNKKGLANKILTKDKNYIRPKEVDLLSLLEINTIDYIFIYRSIAEQNNLNYISLPDQINLKTDVYKDEYKTVSVEVSGKRPGEKTTIYGEPMVYGITILQQAPNHKVALAFLKYFLREDKGMKIIVEEGQFSNIPSPTNYYDKLPEELKEFSNPIL